MKRIAIIGAGISGLTVGYELQKAHFDVTVFEKESSVGGRMSTRVKDGFHFDTGADHLCNLYTRMQEYCEDFGIEWQKMRFDTYGIIKERRMRPLTKGIGLFSKLRLAWFTRTMCPVNELFDFNAITEHDTEAASSFGLRHLGRETEVYYVDGFTSAYQFHQASELSTAPLLAVMNSLKRDGSRWDLHRTKGGMISLPNALAERLHVRTSTTVTRITTSETEAKVTLADQSVEIFDAVIVTAPAPIALMLLANPTKETKALLEQSKFATTISATFRVQKDLVPKRGVTWVPFVESKIISSYSNQAMKGEDCIVGDESLVSIWLHESAAKQLMEKTDAEVFSLLRTELARVTDWLKDEKSLTPHDLQRWEHAMPKFEVGHQRRVKDYLEAHQGKNRLYLCGDYMNALWTEGVLRYGQRLAKRMILELGAIEEVRQ
ncbi:FAD-dependent oxidoreductase [Patescibacteria group bacterium]|nr:FAD-dependent oxidoreductase [Patescibacteria group bacterium]